MNIASQKLRVAKPNDALVDVPGLAAILHLSPITIRHKASLTPQFLPPRCLIPGSSRVVYRMIDVERWLADHVEKRARRPGRPRNT